MCQSHHTGVNLSFYYYNNSSINLHSRSAPSLSCTIHKSAPCRRSLSTRKVNSAPEMSDEEQLIAEENFPSVAANRTIVLKQDKSMHKYINIMPIGKYNYNEKTIWK